MPTHSPADDIQFYYADSGLPSISDYTTYFIVHGHSYHAGPQSFTSGPKSYRLLVGIFQRLLPVAHQHSHRMIAINRREYPNSTSYTSAELSIFAQGSNEERSRLLLGEGTHLALLLDGLVQSLSLPPNIVIIGWSLGTIFTLSMLASITSLSPSVQARLRGSVKKMIMWGQCCLYFLSSFEVVELSKRTSCSLFRRKASTDIYPSVGRELGT